MNTIYKRFKQLLLLVSLNIFWAPVWSQTAASNTNEEIEKAFGLMSLLEQSDWVAKITLIILVLMSVSSWYVIISKLLTQSHVFKMAQEINDAFWACSSIQAGEKTLSEKSPFKFLIHVALEASAPQKGILAPVEPKTWLSISIQRGMSQIQGQMQGGLSWLATVGSTAPFVGLFGTVWGIYNALMKIGLTGQASIDKVAGPVGESLIMTAIGLAVAVPAVLGYNWLVKRNKTVLESVNAFGSDLHSVLSSK